MKLRFTEDSIVVVDELNNSMIIDKETIKRVFNLVEKDSVEVNPQQKILEIIHTAPKPEKVPGFLQQTKSETPEETKLPESVARRYDPVDQTTEAENKKDRLARVITQLNETIFRRVFRGKIDVVPFSELPTELQTRYLHAIKKHKLCDNFKKKLGKACGSIRLSKHWQSYQKELMAKYHEDRKLKEV